LAPERYETNGTFESDILKLYEEMEPLYKELHAYVRRKLYDLYGEVRLFRFLLSEHQPQNALVNPPPLKIELFITVINRSHTQRPVFQTGFRAYRKNYPSAIVVKNPPRLKVSA
jgi:hypothetical protein